MASSSSSLTRMGMNPGGGQVLVSQDLLDQTQVFSGPELAGQNEFHVGLAQPDETRREGPQMAPGKAKLLVPPSPAG
jgi:hypothetical protein